VGGCTAGGQELIRRGRILIWTFRRAGSRDKSLHIVDGATHIATYDTPEFVKQAMAQLVPLYRNAGQASSESNFVGPLSAHTGTGVAASVA
jgi:hypothetical protein